MKQLFSKNIVNLNSELFATVRKITIFYGWFLTSIIIISSLILKDTAPLLITNTAIIFSALSTAILTKVDNKTFARFAPIAVFTFLVFIHLIYTFFEGTDAVISSLFYSLYLVPVIVTSLFFELAGAAITIILMLIGHMIVESYAMSGFSVETYVNHFILSDLPHFIIAAFIGIIGALISKAMKRSQKNLEKFNKKIATARDEWVDTFDSIEDIIIVVDNNNLIQKVNGSASTALCKSGESLDECTHRNHIGRHLFDDYDNLQIIKELKSALSKYAQGEDKEDIRSGTSYFELSVTPLKPLHSTEAVLDSGSIIFLKDISSKRKAERALRETIKVTNTLYKTTESILSTTNKDEILAFCVNNFKMLKNVDFVSVTTMVKDDPEHLQQDVRSENNELTYKPIIGETNKIVAKDAINSGKILYINDIKNESGLDGRLLPRYLRSIVSSPLIINGVPLGTLNIGSTEANSFRPEDLSIIKRFSILTTNAIHNVHMHQQMEGVYLDTVLALSNAIDAKSPWTQNHSVGVANLAVKVAREIGLGEQSIKELNLGVLLHDIGKIGIRDDILNKSSSLTPKEKVIMDKHVIYGANILEPIEKLRHIVPIVKYHHENFDGSGYPEKLAGSEIPLKARIVNVTDSFEAMTTTRPYRKKLSLDEAKKELLDCAGTQFDPEVVDAFLRVMKI